MRFGELTTTKTFKSHSNQDGEFLSKMIPVDKDTVIFLSAYVNKRGTGKIKVKKRDHYPDDTFHFANITLPIEDAEMIAKRLLAFIWESRMKLSGITFANPSYSAWLLSSESEMTEGELKELTEIIKRKEKIKND